MTVDSNAPEPGTANESSGVQDAPRQEHGTPHSGLLVTWRLGQMRWLVILGGLVAGLAAFAIGEATSELIPPESVQLAVQGGTAKGLSRATPRAVTRSSALASGILGACLAGCLGAAGGLARRSGAAAMTWGSFGAVLGLALGAGFSLGVFPLFYWVHDHYTLDDMIESVALHGMIWAPLGAVAGLAFGLGLGKGRLVGRTLAAGLMGALLGAVAFDVLGALFFPLARTADPLTETWWIRLISRLLVSLATALLVALSLSEPRSRRSTPDLQLHRSSS